MAGMGTALIAFAGWPRAREPEYNRKKLSQWVLLNQADPEARGAVLHIGTNDMYGGNPGAAPAKLSKIVDDIAAAAPMALIAVASLIPLASGNDAVVTYNATIPAMVQMKTGAGKHVIFVDQYKDFPTSELTDGIHPNDTNGYPRMANVWYAAIKSYLH